MKKSFFAILCMVSMNLHAQTTGNNPSPGTLASTIEPWKSNRYISWQVPYGSTSAYKVNVYRPGSTRGGILVSSTLCDQNYYRFSPEEMQSTDLTYTIAEYDAATGTLLNESRPAAIGNEPPHNEICYIDCNGRREAYRLSLWEGLYGAKYLSAGEANNGVDPVTSMRIPYYRAISMGEYELLDSDHPYRKATNAGFLRDHVRITPNTPGTYKDANNNPVTNGWLIEKKMDKYAHFNGANSGGNSPTSAWCDANPGTATQFFNGWLDPASITMTPNTWFLTQIGTNQQGHPVYEIPDEMECTEAYGGPGGSGNTGGLGGAFGQAMDTMIYCFEESTDPLSCILDTDFDGDFDDYGGGFIGYTFEAINNHSRFTLTVGNDSGVISVTETTGTFSPGLFRINLFLADGTIVPGYRGINIGVPSVVDSTVLTIAPNPIVNSELAFDVVSTTNKTVTLLVQKLDGSTLYTESVALTANTALSKLIPVTGTIPYNQLRVSVITPNGTSIQKTALTQ